MPIEKLIRMANQIGAFFASEPDRTVALDGVATHLARFWDPRMRNQLVAWVDGGGDDGLSPLVRAAIVTHRDRLARPA
jgi:formate dehydrogenase subunit delta